MPAKEYTVDVPTWVDLTSSDAQAVIPFYENLFGWTSEGSDEYGGYVTFRRNGVAIAGLGGQMPGTTRTDVWNTYIATADADATVEVAATAGAQVVMPAMTVGDQGTMALVANPGGALTGIWQADAHRGYGIWGEQGTPVWHEEFTRSFAPTLEFYGSVFGWQFEVLGDSDEFRYSQARVAGDTIAGIMDASSSLPVDTPSHWRVYFGVDDTDAAVASAIELGGTVVDAAEDSPFGRIAGLADPLGARFQIASVVGSP